MRAICECSFKDVSRQVASDDDGRAGRPDALLAKYRALQRGVHRNHRDVLRLSISTMPHSCAVQLFGDAVFARWGGNTNRDHGERALRMMIRPIVIAPPRGGSELHRW